mmetsp:Transcript_12542/g.25527  ORF Transcript_12542/g.25527 Transcript_12542/m.25527 type:complete len:739 (-) Transcript_12542:113-2329(-)
MALRQLGGAVALVGAPSSVYLISYDSYPGLRRSLQFWSTLGPKLVEYKFLVTRASFQGEEGAKNLPKQLKEFHIRTAGEAVAIILSLGGIYVKLGQLMSTMGAALFEEEYIVALTPLQDGVPPRSFQEVKRIIEDDCGRPMDLLFSSFDPTPIGAASIAQAHHATLADGTAVVVKVQYPEVASHYAADFDNLEVLCGWLFPEKLNLVHGLRKRHEGELDFRVEASNLRECAANAKAKGFMKLREKEQAEKSSSSSSASSFSVPPSPVLACGLGAVGEGLIRSVVLPGVPCEGLVTRHVLAMEFLQGVSLAKAIEQEHQEMAAALGVVGGGAELKRRTMKRMRESFKRGGERERGKGGGRGKEEGQQQKEKEKESRSGSNKREVVAREKGARAATADDDKGAQDDQAISSSGVRSAVNTGVETVGDDQDDDHDDDDVAMKRLVTAVGLLRRYAKVRASVVRSVSRVKDWGSALSWTDWGSGLAGMGGWWWWLALLGAGGGGGEESTKKKRGGEAETRRVTKSEEAAAADSSSCSTSTSTSQKDLSSSVDVGSKVLSLVRFHGVQLLLDGVYNADPHPGNVLVLPDGTLGLIDYGMVGRMSLADRLTVAKVVVALSEGNVEEVARLYKDAGFRATTHSGVEWPPAVVHRIATFHLDRLDLSSVNVAQPQPAQPKEMRKIMKVLTNTIETSVPDWVEQSRRLGGLLIGVASQAGRPISLAKEWEPIARKLLKDHEQGIIVK